MSEPVYGLMAEFKTQEALLAAARAAYSQGYRRLDAYSPFPVDGLSEAIGFKKTRVSLVVLLGGVAGGVTAYLMQYYSAVWDYPLNVGGRPLHSWPSFIPITFELTVLFAAFAALFGMLALNGLPELYHPVFNVPGFKQASQSRFFLCIEANDPLLQKPASLGFLESLNPLSIQEVYA